MIPLVCGKRTPYRACSPPTWGRTWWCNRSRFEVDLNRPPADAVYVHPDDRWGLSIWKVPDPELIDRSRREHDDFYQSLGDVLEQLVDRHGGFVLYDASAISTRWTSLLRSLMPWSERWLCRRATGAP